MDIEPVIMKVKLINRINMKNIVTVLTLLLLLSCGKSDEEKAKVEDW
jgi:hypothetical protein